MSRTHVNNLLAALILIPVGIVFALAGYYLVLKPELRVKNDFRESTCTIVDKRIVHGYSGTGSKRKSTYRPEFDIRYLVDGKEFQASTYDISHLTSNSHSAKQTILDQFEVGKEYPCWYDPAKPEIAVLTREMSWLGYIFTGLGVGLSVIGILVLLFYGGLVAFMMATSRR